MLLKLKILFYQLAYQLNNFYMRAFRVPDRAAVCLIECKGKILLVRNTYGDIKWHLPGGGIKRGESPAETAKREVGEEVGISLSIVNEIGSYSRKNFNKTDTCFAFYSAIENPDFVIDGKEIRDAKWFEWTSFPKLLSDEANRIIQMYLASQTDNIH